MSTVLMVSNVFAWGAFTGFNTHGTINQSAFDLLSKDAAFDGYTFPPLSKIQEHEGVFLNGPTGLITGPGADSGTNSKFQDHYYNPETQKGNGPGAAARHFQALTQAQIDGQKILPFKDFAYGSHFMADMSVPYHVVGMPTADLKAEITKQAGTGKLVFPESVTGKLALLSYGLVFAHGEDFSRESFNFNVAWDDSMDWFDPWYWNGELSDVTRSSHVAWEMWVRDSIDISTLGYSYHWKNPAPSFDQYMDNQLAAIRRMAVGAAAKTYINMEYYFKESMPGLQEATRNVATLWRASFSALKPFWTMKIVNSDPQGITVEVTAEVDNKADEDAKNVQLRFTPVALNPSSVCQLKDSKPVQQFEVLPAKTAKKDLKWTLYFARHSYCAGKLEVIGSFEKTPDLQYGVAYKQMISETEIKELSLSTYINFKYNVTGGHLYTGIHEDGVFQTERDSLIIFKGDGPSYVFDGPHNSQEAHFELKASEDRLLLEQVTLKSQVTSETGAMDNFYTIHNVPLRIFKVFKSVPGLAATIFYLKGQNFLNYIDARKSEGWADSFEWDEATQKNQPVHYTNTLTELLPNGDKGQSEFFAMGISMPSTEVERLIQEGKVDQNLFTTEYGELQDEVIALREEP